VKNYRKKPVVIQAEQLTSENAEELAMLVHGEVRRKTRPDHVSLRIPTLEGVTIASEDDFVIRGVAGEFYACKPEIFDATYEVV